MKHIPRNKHPEPEPTKKAFLAVEGGKYYIDCPDGLHMEESEWYKKHDIYDLMTVPRD